MLAFPAILRPASGGYSPVIKTLSGGQSLSGTEQVVSTLNDRWQASFTFPVRSSDDVLALRAFVTNMRGRVNTVSLPAFDGGRAPWRTDEYGRLITPRSKRNPSLDGTLYADAGNLADTLITASLIGDTAAQATSIEVHIPIGGALKPGHLFSIGSRLYSVLSVTGSGAFYTIGIWPWLRVAAGNSAPINFTSPACEMRFASDGEGADVLKSLSQMRSGAVTLNFDEVAG
jgi:hypothetical protein